MKVTELEALIEAGTETQNLDFKGDCAWNAGSFAKDIMAMTNVQDGGRIVIGVKENDDGTYEKQGVSSDNVETFERDIMLDQIAKYTDPHVSFTVEFVKDSDELTFIVISIDAFQEVPVICRKDATELQAGVLYYRNRDKKPESARISNSFDMRDVVERAAIKLMQRAKRVGYEVPDKEQGVNKALSNERGDL